MENPYQAPAAVEVVASSVTDSAMEHFRRSHLGREKALHAVGILYQLIGIGCLLLAVGIAERRLGSPRGPVDLRMVIVYSVLSLCYLTVGTGICRFRGWARIAGIVLALPFCIRGPLLLGIGVLALVVLIPRAAETVCTPAYRAVIAATPYLTSRMRSMAGWILIPLTVVAVGVYLLIGA